MSRNVVKVKTLWLEIGEPSIVFTASETVNPSKRETENYKRLRIELSVGKCEEIERLR